MFKIKAAAVALACFAFTGSVAAQSVPVELALAHAYLDDELERGLRAEVGSVSALIPPEADFTPAEMLALEVALDRELELTITETQNLIAKAASDAFTEAELRAPETISGARWQAVLAPLSDRLSRMGATLAAKAILSACGSIPNASESCIGFSKVARDFLNGDISMKEIEAAAGG